MAIKWGRVSKLPRLVSVVNPARPAKKAGAKKRTSSAQSPKKEKPKVKKTTKKKATANNKPKTVVKKYYMNPKPKPRKKPRKSHHKANPSIAKSVASAPSNLVKEGGTVLRLGAVGAVSGIAVKEATQYALQGQNAGWKGYLGNIGMTAAFALLARAMGVKRMDVLAIMAGGGIATVLRGFNESTNPVAASVALSGLGDASTYQVGQQLRARLAASRMRGVPAGTGAPSAQHVAAGRSMPIRTANGLS
jgi:hypothetical protein